MKDLLKNILSRLFAKSCRDWSIHKVDKKPARSVEPNPNTKQYWNNKLSKFGVFWRNENYYHILEILPKNKEFSLLDIGCAIGDGCELIQDKFPKAKITGVDISNIGIEKARHKTKSINYFILNILKDSLPNTYDFISIVQTLEHFDNPFFILDKCLKHVRRSVIVSVPYSPRLTGRFDHGEHRYFFNEKTFVDTKYKFRISKITNYVETTGSRCIVYEFFPH